MKILVFYTPRSKSTAIHDALAAKFSIEPFGDTFTKSRIANKGFTEYSSLIEHVNSATNICVKLNGNDFIDLNASEISTLYQDINFCSFNKIIFATRTNLVDAVSSYAYMDPTDSSTWHTQAGKPRVCSSYTVPDSKVFYLLRGYKVFETIKQHILAHSLTKEVYYYEYESVESRLLQDFSITTQDLAIEPNKFDYTKTVINYADLKELVPAVWDLLGNDLWHNKLTK